jgi:hypothetical protein
MTMKVSVEKISNDKGEMIEVINRCLEAVESITTLDEAYTNIDKAMGNVCFWRIGRGGSHIWVSNHKNERLLLITE